MNNLVLKKSSYLVPYWSKQHGAYITLIVSWLIAVLLSQDFSWMQPVILIFLLSSLNLTELLIESMIRKSPMSGRKKVWMLIYSLTSVSLAGLLAYYLKSLIYVLPVLSVFAIVFIFLAIRKQQKSILAEWITFAMFAIASLLAFNPEQGIVATKFLVLGLLMSAYFGQSIFLVKSRLKRLPNYMALIYSFAVIIILFSLFGIDAFTLMLSFLLIAKSLQILIWNDWYNKLKIKFVGMLEMGYHLLFLILLLVFSGSVLEYKIFFDDCFT